MSQLLSVAIRKRNFVVVEQNAFECMELLDTRRP